MLHRINHQKRKLSFTLVELLVVIAVICILAALLMPGLQQALGQSRSVSCLSNLQQQSVALGNYLELYNNFFPTANFDNWSNSIHSESVFSYRFWQDQLLETKELSWTTSQRYIPAMRCPETTTRYANQQVIDYGGNGGFRMWEGSVNGKHTGIMGQNGYGANIRNSGSSLPAPGTTLAIACYVYSAAESKRGCIFTYVSQSWVPLGQRNHLNNFNNLFVDGHATSTSYFLPGWSTRAAGD